MPVTNPKARVAIVTLLSLLALSTVLGGFYTVDEGHRGLLLRWGKLVDVVDAGVHFKMPWIESTETMSIRTQKLTAKMAVYSKDVQSADIVLSINFALSPDKVGNMFSVGGLGYVDRLVMPQLLSRPKDIFGKHSAANIVNARDALTSEIHRELESRLAEIGVVLQSVQLENIDFSDSYEKSVEERMKAEVEVQRVKQNLEREKINADMLRTRAKGQADARIAEAEGRARSIELTSRAEAEAIRVKNQALREGGPEYVRLVQAERWDGKLPQTMVPTGTTPIVSVK